MCVVFGLWDMHREMYILVVCFQGPFERNNVHYAHNIISCGRDLFGMIVMRWRIWKIRKTITRLIDNGRSQYKFKGHYKGHFVVTREGGFPTEYIKCYLKMSFCS